MNLDEVRYFFIPLAHWLKKKYAPPILLSSTPNDAVSDTTGGDQGLEVGEQEIHNIDLNKIGPEKTAKLVEFLLRENTKLDNQNWDLKAENERLRGEVEGYEALYKGKTEEFECARADVWKLREENDRLSDELGRYKNPLKQNNNEL